MNPPNGQSPLDYLNQIAPQAPKRQGFGLNLKTVLIGGALLIVLVIILAIVVNSTTSGRKTSWEQLSLRLATTEKVATSATPLIKSSQLRSYNSDLKLYLANTQRDLAAPLTALNIVPAKIDKTLVSKEAGTELTAALEDGRLNAKYDSTYAREMGYQLATILTLLKELYGKSSASQQTFLQTAYDNLYPTYTSIQSFSTTTE